MASRRLIQRCTKPDQKEFKKIASSCSLGFALMGFIGYLDLYTPPKNCEQYGNDVDCRNAGRGWWAHLEGTIFPKLCALHCLLFERASMTVIT